MQTLLCTAKQTLLSIALEHWIVKSARNGFESRIPWECFQFFNRIENSITFAVTIVIQKSRDLIGTLGIAEFGPF